MLGSSAPQLAEAKRKSDDDQTQMEELRGGRKKMEKDMEALRERVDELMTENQRVTRSKKKIQEEVKQKWAVLLLCVCLHMKCVLIPRQLSSLCQTVSVFAA